MLKLLALLFMGCALLAGCYRMPTDEDFCVIPTTNHPDIVHDQNTSLAPNLKY